MLRTKLSLVILSLLFFANCSRSGKDYGQNETTITQTSTTTFSALDKEQKSSTKVNDLIVKHEEKLKNSNSVYLSDVLKNDPTYTDFDNMDINSSLEQYLKKEDQVNKENKKPLLVVGAGPTGLLTVIEAYKRGIYPIYLVEKRSNYARNIIVRVDKNHLDTIHEIIGETNYRNILANGLFEYVDQSKHPAITKSITLNILEKLLASIVEKLAKKAPQKLKVFYGYEFDSNQDFQEKNIVFTKKESGMKFYLKRPSYVIGADSTNSAVRAASGIKFDQVSDEVYAGIGIFSNLDALSNSSIIRPVYYVYNQLDQSYDSNLLAEELKNYHWDSSSINWQANDQQILPRYRLFINNWYLYFGLEFTKDQYEYFKNLKDPKVMKEYQEYLRIRLKGIIGEDYAYQMSSLSDGLSFSIFPVQLMRARRPFAKINGTTIILVGDALATTHFFTGTGVNRGFDDSKQVIKFIADGVKFGDRLKTEYFFPSVNNMHLKSAGGTGSPPDSRSFDGFHFIHPSCLQLLDEIGEPKLLID